ncbi:MAG TPA: type II CAAX endopeptidase family protein [Spirochaetia bacterium]|nr:type II CAAX endopeptidase family protein [Spirochaetia bacterium]
MRAESGVFHTDLRRRLFVAGLSVLAALLLWYFVFVFPYGKFWIKMAIATPILAAVSISQIVPRREDFRSIRLRHIIIGVGSAVFLYGVFFVGKQILAWIMPGSHGMIASVYATGQAIPLWIVALLLLFVTSPAEEIYWRRFIQRTLGDRFGRLPAFFVTVGLYTLVHVVTLNPALILAAFVAGSVWGLIFYYEQSIVPTLISHALWATTIFVILPVM